MSLELLFIITALATFRLARMVTQEAGPGDVFGRFRRWLDNRYQGRKTEGTIHQLFHCSHCLGFWLAFVVFAVGQSGIGRVLVLVIAVAGLASILQRWGGFDFQ